VLSDGSGSILAIIPKLSAGEPSSYAQSYPQAYPLRVFNLTIPLREPRQWDIYGIFWGS